MPFRQAQVLGAWSGTRDDKAQHDKHLDEQVICYGVHISRRFLVTPRVQSLTGYDVLAIGKVINHPFARPFDIWNL